MVLISGISWGSYTNGGHEQGSGSEARRPFSSATLDGVAAVPRSELGEARRYNKIFNVGQEVSAARIPGRAAGTQPEHKPAEKKEYAPRGQTPAGPPKTINMPGYREVVRCRGCGNELTVVAAWTADGVCTRCGADLHTCAQCVNFDTGAALECLQAIPVRVSPKDRATRARSSSRARPSSGKRSRRAPTSARSAFDDLFK